MTLRSLRTVGSLAVAVLLILDGCASPVPPASPSAVTVAAAPLNGQAIFPERRVQATTADVAVAATVSFIDTASNRTLATTVSDGSGNFSLAFSNGFVPTSGTTYYLEAVKGLGNHMPSHAAARVRTIVTYLNGSWYSITNGAIVIDAATTALSVAAALRASTATPVSFNSLIDSYDSFSETYMPVPNLSQADFATVRAMVVDVLTRNHDPIGKLSLSALGAFEMLDAPAPMLAAIDNPLVNAGSLLTVEGSFADGAVANFPGVGSVPMQMVSSHRAQVIVPSTALTGSLSVTQPGGNSSSLPYRLVSFPLGLGYFGLFCEQAGMARRMPNLSTGRYHHSTEVVGNYVYHFGGIGQSGQLNSIERATINADGTLGPFTTAGALSTPRFGHTSEVIGNFVYLFGGNSGGVERAAINQDGTLGPFSNVTGTGLSPHQYHAGEVIGNYVYIFGGFGINPPRVERAPINSDGTIGSFSLVTSVSNSYRYHYSSAIIGNYVYLFGGFGPSAVLQTIERAPIRADGTLGPFSLVPQTLQVPRHGHKSVVMGDYIYVFGGAPNTVERAPILPDGNIGSFTDVPGVLFTSSRFRSSVAVLGNALYQFGGVLDGNYLDTIEYAQFNANGSLGVFNAVSGVTLANARRGHRSFVVGSKIYVLGGYSDNGGFLNTLEVASVNADGTVGSFSTVPGVQLNISREDPTVAVVGNYIYVMGGHNDDSGYLNNIERALINPNGTLGTFTNFSQTHGVVIPARSRHTCAVLGNQVFLFGGQDSSGIRNEILVANFTLPSDAISSFALAGTLSAARSGHTTVVAGQRVYHLGGFNGGPLTSTEFSNIDMSTGSLGGSTPGPSLSTGRYAASGAVVGNRIYLFGGENSSGSLSTTEFATTTFNSISSFSPGPSLSSPREQNTSAVFGNQIYLFGGFDGTGNTGSIERALLN